MSKLVLISKGNLFHWRTVIIVPGQVRQATTGKTIIFRIVWCGFGGF